MNSSFNAFLSYVVSSTTDHAYNNHWIPQYIHCLPCAIQYDYVTHLENSFEEVKYLFKLFRISNLTYVPGQYEKLPGDESERKSPEFYWKDTPKWLIKKFYK